MTAFRSRIIIGVIVALVCAVLAVTITAALAPLAVYP